MGKPSWAGKPGGPGDSNGGGDDGGGDTSTTSVLYIEVDYMEGHEPTPSVLTYITNYYALRGVEVTFYADLYDEETGLIIIDDPYSNIVPDDPSVTDNEFWAIEDTYNNNDHGYLDHWKWVLFGTTVAGASDVVGYCWVVTSSRDILGGNYIYIADKTADDWATTLELAIGAEATVLMHELGHSIGIGKLHPRFGERYDPDPGSVMSYLSESNAGLYGLWYYSDEYWATNNMEYYEEIVA
jgi:hypothetical protein